MKMDPIRSPRINCRTRKRLSMQRHEERGEHWFVSEGTVLTPNVSSMELRGIYTETQVCISCNEWHLPANELTT